MSELSGGARVAIAAAVITCLITWPGPTSKACGPEWIPPIPIGEAFPFLVMAPDSTHQGRIREILWDAATGEIELPPEPSWNRLREQRALAAAHYQAEVEALAAKAGVDIPMPPGWERERNGYDACDSNTLAAMQAFFDAAAAERKLAAADRAELVLLRHGVREHACHGRDEEAKTRLAARIDAARGKRRSKRLAAYLDASLAFYLDRYDEAEAGFRALSGGRKDDWVSDTAHYMVARTLLVGAQERWPDRHWKEEAVRAEARQRREAGVGEARRAFEDYVEARPDGRYVSSAIGLRRFMHAVLDDRAGLDTELVELYRALRAGDPSIASEARAARLREVLHHYRGDGRMTEPVLYLAGLLRSPSPGVFALGDVEAERAAFERIPGLYDFTRAVLLWRQGDLDGLTALELDERGTESGAPRLATAARAIQARGLERRERFDEAAALWASLVGTADHETSTLFVQARVIENTVRAGRLADLFTTNAFAIDPRLRRVLFEGGLDAAQLETLIADDRTHPEAREEARHALAHWRLYNGEYTRFLEVYAALDTPGDFAQVETAARMLARDPDSTKGALNAGHFLMHHRLTPRPWVPGGLAQLPGARMRQGVTLRQPYDYFVAVIEASADRPPSTVEAKALHYAVQCFHPGSRSHGCWWHGRPWRENPSKAYFERLHARYPGSIWAERTPYSY